MAILTYVFIDFGFSWRMLLISGIYILLTMDENSSIPKYCHHSIRWVEIGTRMINFVVNITFLECN